MQKCFFRNEPLHESEEVPYNADVQVNLDGFFYYSENNCKIFPPITITKNYIIFFKLTIEYFNFLCEKILTVLI